MDTRSFESDGLLRAELFVLRPAIAVAAEPLENIVTICSGLNRPVGTRYVRVALEP